MLPSQRDLFDVPRDVCYLNAASWSPLPLATQEAGRAPPSAGRASPGSSSAISSPPSTSARARLRQR